MTPDEHAELQQLRLHAESEADRRGGEMTTEQYLRLDALEEKAERESTLGGRFHAIAERVTRAVRLLVGRETIPHDDAPLPPVVVDTEASPDDDGVRTAPPETPEETALRIHKDYLRGVEQFRRQRDEWRGMFEESWPHHLAALRLLERVLLDGREQLVLLTVVARGLGWTVHVSPKSLPDAPPQGLADAYEAAMRAVVAGCTHAAPDPAVGAAPDPLCAEHALRPGVDVDAERIRVVEAHPSGELSSTRASSRELFALIRTIEAERNAWNARCRREMAWHIEAQTHLQAAIDSAASSHARMLAAINSKRAAASLGEIRTLAELKSAAEAGA